MSLFIALYKKIFISMVTDFKDLIQSPSSSKKLRTWFCILLPARLFHARVEIQLQAATAQLGFIEWKIQSFHALFMQHTVFQIILLLTLLRQLSEKKKCAFFTVTLVLISLLQLVKHVSFHCFPGILRCRKQHPVAKTSLCCQRMPSLHFSSIFSLLSELL